MIPFTYTSVNVIMLTCQVSFCCKNGKLIFTKKSQKKQIDSPALTSIYSIPYSYFNFPSSGPNFFFVLSSTCRNIVLVSIFLSIDSLILSIYNGHAGPSNGV